MKIFLILAFLLSASAFAESMASQEDYEYKDLVQTTEISQDETFREEYYQWNGNSSEDEYRRYIQEVQYRGGHNMGPRSKYGIMKGTGQPMMGGRGAGLNWGTCTRAMVGPTPGGPNWVRTPKGWWRNPAYAVKPNAAACARL